MWNTLSIIKELIFWALPLFFLSLYLKKVYDFSFGQLVIWWTKNYSNVDSPVAIIVAFLIIFFLFTIPASSLINSTYLGLFGEKQTLVYLGNSSDNTAVYFKQYDNERATFTGYDLDNKYNYSFNNVLKVRTFVKDPGTTDIVGQASKRLQVPALLSTFFFMIFLLLPALAASHALSYPMYTDTHGENAHLHGAPMDAFETLLADYKITKVSSAGIFFISLFLGIYFGSKMQNNEDKVPAENLASYIYPGETIYGMPNEIEIKYVKRRDRSDKTSYDNVDSGERYVNFEFTKGFSKPVYVATVFTIEQQPELEDAIKENINNRTSMPLKVNDNLSITLDTSPDKQL